MKNLLLTFAFALVTFAVNAQESSKNSVIEPTNKTEVTTSNEDKICYGEKSKAAFFQSLIEVNGLNMEIKEDYKVAIRSTEQIIKKSKNQILYSQLDKKGQLTDF